MRSGDWSSDVCCSVLLARLEGYSDQRITQKLILQPMAEANFALQDVPETGSGEGLSDFELGLRLRCEIVKEFAPCFGVGRARKGGDTARFGRTAGMGAARVRPELARAHVLCPVTNAHLVCRLLL